MWYRWKKSRRQRVAIAEAVRCYEAMSISGAGNERAVIAEVMMSAEGYEGVCRTMWSSGWDRCAYCKRQLVR